MGVLTMRLVDAEGLFDNIYYNVSAPYEEAVAAKEDCLCMIEEAPIIDAVIVTHGHWETSSDRPDSLICSVCKCGFDMWKHDPHNFCPNCGSKMDGELNE